MTDKRNVPRIKIKFPVTYRDRNDDHAQQGNSKSAMLTNLGKTGLCLNSVTPIEQGAVCISGTDNFSRLTVTGEVVYSRRQPPSIPDAPDKYETGVRFTDTPDNILEFITTVVKTAGKGPKPQQKQDADTRRPDREETLTTTVSPDIVHEPEIKGRTVGASQPPPVKPPQDNTGAEESFKKFQIPFIKRKPVHASPVTAPLPDKPYEDAGLSDQEIPPYKRSSFSAELTGLVISALILLSTAIVIAPTPFKKHFRFLKEIDIQLPFQTKSNEPTTHPPPANELILTENSTTCDFIRNIISGPVLVIKGTLPPQSQFTKDNPKITGRLLNKAGTVLKEVEVCAGATLSDVELSSCQPQEMEKMLREPTDINPQAAVKPYMIVFTNLPENMDGLHAEIVISPPP